MYGDEKGPYTPYTPSPQTDRFEFGCQKQQPRNLRHGYQRLHGVRQKRQAACAVYGGRRPRRACAAKCSTKCSTDKVKGASVRAVFRTLCQQGEAAPSSSWANLGVLRQGMRRWEATAGIALQRSQTPHWPPGSTRVTCTPQRDCCSRSPSFPGPKHTSLVTARCLGPSGGGLCDVHCVVDRTMLGQHASQRH